MILQVPLIFVFANQENFDEFEDGAANCDQCHSGYTLLIADGIVELSIVNNDNNTVNSGTYFYINLNIINFTDGINCTVALGFRIEAYDNSEFLFKPTKKFLVPLDANGSLTSPLDFAVIAPTSPGNYTIQADVTEGAEGSSDTAIYWIWGNLDIIVSPRPGVGGEDPSIYDLEPGDFVIIGFFGFNAILLITIFVKKKKDNMDFKF